MPASLPNYLTIPAGTHTIPLQWKGDSLNGQWEPQAYLLIPVSVPGCSRRLYMQFDTGSPFTLLYRPALKTVHKAFPATTYLQQLNDTLTNFHFRAGPLPILLHKAPAIDHGGAATGPNAPLIIGTIGTDLIDNKIVTIDYAGLQLTIGDTLPASWRQQASAGFNYAMRRILLPGRLKNKKTILYFDSGSSAFELLTDKATCLQLAADSLQVTSYPVQSWGRTLTANSLPANDSITLAGVALPLHRVTWIEGVSATQVQQMMQMGIGGMTGNKLFMHRVLLLDTRSRRFMLF